ncbi:zf-HC2 domain-containing protein, partial [bacterium]|nr:zf-HC2 domain-containing protein [bacterium]
MNCCRAKSLFSAHLDNELGHEETQELNEHLANCAECRGAIEELRRMKRLVGGVNYRLPDSFSDEVLQQCRNGRVEVESDSRRPLVPRFRFALAAGLLVSAVGAAFLVLDFDTEPDSTTTETTTATIAAESVSDEAAVITESEEIIPAAEPVAQTAGNYLTSHLANSEVAINSDDVISRHVVAD